MNGYYLRFALAWLVSVSVVGVGCTSAPVRYYTLTPPPDKPLPASETPLAIDVRVVHIPPQLNRSELMVRTGPTEVTLLENERWASPVNDEIKDALRLELQRRLGRMTGLRPDFAKADARHRRATSRGGIRAVRTARGVLECNLSATGPRSDGARATTCTFRADEEIHTGYAEIVEGYQREIAALADAIAAVLTSPASGIDAPCQKSIESSAE